MRLDRFVNRKTQCGQKRVRQLLAAGQIRLDGEICNEGTRAINQFSRVELAGELLQEARPYYLMLHKPRACVSATRDKKHPTVVDLIKESYRSELHIAGRLDFNTTGLMLLTNDGQWSRRITEPAEKKPKTYLLTTQDPMTVEYKRQFSRGIYLAREAMTTHSAELEIIEPRLARLTIYEGRYHQVKRMLGFFNNRVLSLHRERMGSIVLDPLLQAGHYRPLSALEIASVTASCKHTGKPNGD